MTPAFRQLLNRFAMPAFERQMAFLDLVGDAPEWDLDLKGGTATVAGRTMGLHLFGTRSNEGDWMWAWAQKKAPVPAAALASAKKVRQVGKKRAIAELAEESFPLAPLELDGHTVALVATAIAELPAYFRFPYAGGTLFAGLDAPALPAPDFSRITKVVREVAERFDLDSRTAFDGYLRSHGATVEGRGDLVARLPGGAVLTAGFDPEGRLSTLRPLPAASAS